jgi:hypothetical protein
MKRTPHLISSHLMINDEIPHLQKEQSNIQHRAIIDLADNDTKYTMNNIVR